MLAKRLAEDQIPFISKEYAVHLEFMYAHTRTPFSVLWRPDADLHLNLSFFFAVETM